jgi:molybdate transport system substrate-binding protein
MRLGKFMSTLAAASAIGLLATIGPGAHAAEIKALITTALKTSIDDLAPQFQRATGHTLRASYGPSSTLTKRIAEGEDADFVILGGDGIDVLIRQRKVMDGSGVKFARSMIGAAVAEGAPKPDISSADAFKRALLAARSVAYSDAAGGGASGVYLAKAFEKMGIAAALKAKAKLAAGGPDGFAAAFVAIGSRDRHAADT